MGRATSEGNEMKSKMKQPSDMPHRDSNTGGSDPRCNMLSQDHGGAPCDPGGGRANFLGGSET